MAKLKDFFDLEMQETLDGSLKRTWAHLYFPNGYGVSVVWMESETVALLNSKGWELAVMEGSCLEDGRVCYDTKITNDTIRNLGPNEVSKLMARIQRLPPSSFAREKQRTKEQAKTFLSELEKI